jgi:preprotein translocase subunit SecA
MGSAGAAYAGVAYPEREEPREDLLQRAVTRARYLAGGIRRPAEQLAAIVAATDSAAVGLEDLSDTALRGRAGELSSRLRLAGWRELALSAQAFALVREAARRSVGQRHFDVQLMGGWAMLNGMLAEMETGEGKTLSATLAAATAALAGRAVHVITVNDYLAERDSEWMRPIYAALGLDVGCVRQGMDPDSRRTAYRAAITYCSNKEIAFDYLRDRLVLRGRPRAIAMKVGALEDSHAGQRLLLRGLQFAIVDEADSVLIDEARTPLILSADSRQGQGEALYRSALDLARELGEGDFRRGETGIELTGRGVERIAELCAALTGVWRGPRRREQLLRRALAALHQFERDRHYLVRDGKVVIIDETTGRLMPDRSWEQGLHQLVELKEGCKISGERETLARISYQRFFRRYVHLAGMTGTASEVAAELWGVYRLRVARIPTSRPSRRRREPDRIFGGSQRKWQAVVESTARHRDAGRAVLIGTRSVAASEQIAAMLAQRGLPHRLLNARQDRDEAEIIAGAGMPGCITVATNMAGRGTDIKLAGGVAESGGLHVIATELNDSGRIDRQLFGRCARQGDPGSCEAILAIEEDLVASYLPGVAKRLSRIERLPNWLGRLVFAVAQWRSEHAHSVARRELLELDDYLGDVLAFAGRGE